jgi:hypothetical protein
MRHLIQKEVFEISAPSLRLAQEWESRAPDLIRRTLTPCLEECFDQTASGNANVVIDRLEIDLGILHAQTSRQEIMDRITQVMMRANGTSCSVEPAHPHTPELQHRELSGHELIFECFVHFLRHGLLPWWAETDVCLESDWIERATRQDADVIAQMLSQRKHARSRLVQQFSVELVAKVLQLFAPEQAAGVLAGWKWLESGAPVRGARFAELRSAYWTYWIGCLAGGEIEDAGLVDAFKQWLQDTPEAKSRLYELLNDKRAVDADQDWRAPEATQNLLKAAVDVVLEARSEKRTLQKSDRTPAEKQGPEGHPAQDGLDSLEPLPNRAERSDHVRSDLPTEARHPGFDDPASERRDREAKEKEVSAVNGENASLYVEDAGLVLLHPFLPELFRTVRLWDDKEWSSPRTRHYAVHLVSWLAHGEISFPEYRLIMPKLLCGMQWEEALDMTVTLEPDHLHSGAELLESVIAHWRVLGRTSIEGLREGFIARAGKLATREDGWFVTVEKKAQDILLGKLPWGISVIQLPWLEKKCIRVDWA